MPRKFRFTCARTSYFEIELEAENDAAAEEQLAAALTENPGLPDSAAPLGNPICRVVEVAGTEQQTAGASHAEAA